MTTPAADVRDNLTRADAESRPVRGKARAMKVVSKGGIHVQPGAE